MIRPSLAPSSQASWPRRALWLLLGVHASIWILEPIFSAPNIPLDTAEITIMGRTWAWGYHNHPPLPAWLADLAHHLSEPAYAATALAVACQLSVVATFWLVWRLARSIMAPLQALLAVLLLETTAYYTWVTREWNHSLVMLPFVALAILSFHHALRTNQMWRWVVLGMSVGLGALCKYSMGLLGLAIGLFAIFNPRARATLRTPGPYLAVGIAVLIFLPHLVWLVQHEFPTLHYMARRASSAGGAKWWLHVPAFVGGQVAYLGLFFVALLAVVAFPLKLRSLTGPERETRDLLLAVVLGPSLILILGSVLTGRSLVTAWAMPFWSCIGIVMMLVFETSNRVSRGVATCVALAILNLSGTIAADTIWPCVRGRAQRVHFPGRALTDRVHAEWRGRFDAPLAMIAGDRWIADNVAFYAPNRPRALVYDIDLVSYPTQDLREFSQRGGVLLWNADSHGVEVPAFLREDFPDAQALPAIEVAWMTRCALPPLHIGFAIVTPTEGQFSP